jgi:hypothetical protein
VIFWKYFRQKWVFLTKFEPFVRENVMMCFQENFRIFAENWSKSPKISIITLTHFEMAKAGLPDGIYSKEKFQFWYILEVLMSL